jgi:hypothetical protein
MEPVITKGMADFETVKSHFTNNNLSYYSFFPRSQKPIKVVIRHLPRNSLAEDISDELVNQGVDVINAKQLTNTAGHLPREQRPETYLC